MAQVSRCNLVRSILAANDAFCTVWALACTMIKAGAIVKAASDGTTKVVAGITATGFGGAPGFPWAPLTAVPAQAGTGPTLAALTNNGLVTVTGLSGLVAPTAANAGGSEGNFLAFTGFINGANNGIFQIAEYVSATACRIYNPSAVVPDANSGNVGVTWSESSIITAAYVSATWSGKAPWLVLETHRMVVCPLTTAATLIRGEKVTQGTGSTLCEGEYLGSVFDTTAGSPTINTGWAVIQPRDRNTWAQTAITGATSGNSFTPSAAPKVFVDEQAIWKSSANYTQGSMYWCCLDASADAANLFSALAAQSFCTAAVAPGGTATGTNASMPTVAGVAVMQGTAAVAVGATWPATSQAHANWYSASVDPSATANKFNVLCANGMGTPTSPLVTGAAATVGRSPDCSYTVVDYNLTSPQGMQWGRLDETEPGCVSPFYVFSACGDPGPSYNRFSNTNGTVSWDSTGVVLNTSFTPNGFKGFTARGCGVAARDLYQPWGYEIGNLNYTLISSNYSVVPRTMNHPAATPPMKVTGGYLFNNGAQVTGGNAAVGQVKGRVGRPRWQRWQPVAGGLATYDTFQWLGVLLGSNSNPGVEVGPWDGASTPATS